MSSTFGLMLKNIVQETKVEAHNAKNIQIYAWVIYNYVQNLMWVGLLLFDFGVWQIRSII